MRLPLLALLACSAALWEFHGLLRSAGWLAPRTAVWGPVLGAAVVAGGALLVAWRRAQRFVAGG